MAVITIYSSEIKSILDEDKLIFDEDNISSIFKKLLNDYPELRSKIFIDEEKMLVKNKLLIFHNNKLINKNNLNKYNKKIKQGDTIKLLSAFSGG